MQKLEIENETLTKALEASQQAASLQDELDRARSVGDQQGPECTHG